jgi:hypothetical protein
VDLLWNSGAGTNLALLDSQGESVAAALKKSEFAAIVHM